MARQSELESLVPKLRRYARGLTGRAGTADDLVQDAILSALRSRGMGSGSALLHRLYAIVTDFNRLRIADLDGQDDYATEVRGAVVALRRTPGAPPARTDAPRLSGPDPLAALTLEEREALLLVTVEGLGYEAAAAIAGISPLALVARLSSARNRMTALLAGQSASAPGRATTHRHLRIVS